MDDTEQKNQPQALHASTAAGKKQKRKLTRGELVFDFSVYGGISWILNEFISTIITNSIYEWDVEKLGPKNPPATGAGPKPSLIKTLFNPNGKFYEPFEATYQWLYKRMNPLKWGKTPFFLATEMFVMCLGGSILVAPTKWIEDRKGKIVRGFDKLFYGQKDNDKLEAAHKDMDNAPQQSWGSLWKGRLLVLVSAISLHFVAGAERPPGPKERYPYIAPSTRWLQGTFMEKYSNLSRIMKTGTRDILSLKWMPFISQEHKDAMRAARTASGVPAMTEAEGVIAMQLGKTLGYVLSVSAAMATLFFVSSRVFASMRDEKKERKQPADHDHISLGGNQDQPDESEQPAKREDQASRDAPTPKISQIENHLTVRQNANAIEITQ